MRSRAWWWVYLRILKRMSFMKDVFVFHEGFVELVESVF